MWYNFFGDSMLIDTHCHLSLNDYENIEDIIKSMNGIMIVSGVDDDTNKEVLDLIKKYDNVYGTLGIHPEQIDTITQNSFKLIEENLNNPKIVGIGEIGLDYHFVNNNKIEQQNLLKKQLDLATIYKKPVVIHSRDAIQDTFDILKEYDLKGTIHCFSSSLEMASEFIKLGYKIGVGGTLTFKNSLKIQEIVKLINIKDILLETDSPYLSPEPLRGRKNVPGNVLIIAKKVSELKNLDLEDVIQITGTTAIELFDLKI